METVVEHWWNGTWATLFRIDFWLQVDGGIWQIRIRWSTYPERTPSYASEADARQQLALWLDELSEEGSWRRVDQGPRP